MTLAVRPVVMLVGMAALATSLSGCMNSQVLFPINEYLLTSEDVGTDAQGKSWGDWHLYSPEELAHEHNIDVASNPFVLDMDRAEMLDAPAFGGFENGRAAAWKSHGGLFWATSYVYSFASSTELDAALQSKELDAACLQFQVLQAPDALILVDDRTPPAADPAANLMDRLGVEVVCGR